MHVPLCISTHLHILALATLLICSHYSFHHFHSAIIQVYHLSLFVLEFYILAFWHTVLAKIHPSCYFTPYNFKFNKSYKTINKISF